MYVYIYIYIFIFTYDKYMYLHLHMIFFLKKGNIYIYMVQMVLNNKPGTCLD